MKAKKLGGQSLRKKKVGILVVEDEAGVALALGGRLECYGYHICDVVSTAQDTIASALRHQPDLILMDTFFAEDRNGIEAVEHISARLDVPIIFLAYLISPEAMEPAVNMSSRGFPGQGEENMEPRLNIEIALFRHQTAKEREKLNIGLEEALGKIRKLSGLLPICTSCRQLRVDREFWPEIENHVASQAEAYSSNGFGQECSRKHNLELFQCNFAGSS